MNTQEKRIKLAEAMNLPAVKSVKKNGFHAGWFNPFIDANDDYSVLRWMRDGGPRKDSYPFFATVEEQGQMKWDYQIGDYAKAALQVIK